jgi:hypothetical protein
MSGAGPPSSKGRDTVNFRSQGSIVTTNARTLYAELRRHAEIRSKELAPLLAPYLDLTDRYGEFVCGIVAVLGQMPPASPRDAATRDLIADVFDFLYEARALVTKGKLEVAYPLARRAYESLSLLVACTLEPKVADRWIAGKQIGHAEVRRVLAAHPMGEKETQTRELYDFFSKSTHPNRDHVAHRFLGEGNEFVLGAIGKPSLVGRLCPQDLEPMVLVCGVCGLHVSRPCLTHRSRATHDLPPLG